jgi:hypothetical protein
MRPDLFVCWYITPTASIKTRSLEPAVSIERIQNPNSQSIEMVGVPRYQRQIVGQGCGSDLLVDGVFRVGNT